MKALTTLTLFLCITLSSIYTTQAQETPDANGVTCTGMVVDEFGNTYICGYFQGFVGFGRSMLKSKEGSTDIFLAKYSKDGGNIWAVRAGGEGTDVAQAITIDSKGYVYVTGYFQEFADFEHRKIQSRGRNDIFFAKYNSSGGINALKTFGGRGSEESIALDVDAEGNIYMAGSFTDKLSIAGKSIEPRGSSSVFITKFSKLGRAEWAVPLGSDGGRVLLNDMDVDQRGNLFVCGAFTEQLLIGEQILASKGELDGYVVMLSSTGGLVYAKLYGTEYTDFARAISGDGTGNAIVVGHTVRGMSSRSGFVYKLDPQGNMGSSETWELRYETNFQDVVIGQDNNIVICGSFNEFEQFGSTRINSSQVDGFVLSCNTKLSPQWAFASQGKLNGKADLLSVNQEGMFHVGLNRSRKEGKYEQAVFLAKIDQSAELIWSTEVGAAERSDSFDPSSTYVDFKGKLLKGGEFLKPVVDGAVELLDEGGNILEETKTDNYGDFTFHNLNTKNEYSIKAPEVLETSGQSPIFIANQSGMILGEIGKDGTSDFSYKILPTELAEIAKMDVRDTELKVDKFLSSEMKEVVIDLEIYYETGAFEIPKAYELELKSIARDLRSERDIKIEIASYTDAIGEANDNLSLSEKRAKAIVDFLISRKVSADAIDGKGYGESGIVNRCVDGVEDCSDREHQANRRTEIKLSRKG